MKALKVASVVALIKGENIIAIGLPRWSCYAKQSGTLLKSLKGNVSSADVENENPLVGK